MNDLWKIRVGKLIYHYREQLYQETKREIWKQENFLKNESGWICSRPTFSNMKKGIPIRDIKVYFILADKLNKKIKIDSKIDESINDYSKLLYDAELVFDVNEIINICNQALTTLSPYKDCMYYEEYYQLFYKLSRYYSLKDALFTIKEYQHFNSIFKLFNNNMQEVLVYLFLVFGFQTSKKLSDDIISNYRVKTKTYFPIKLVYLTHKNTISKYSAVEEYKKLEKEAIMLKSFHLISIYRGLMIRYEDLETEKAFIYADKLEEVIKDHRISKIQKNNIVSNLGLFYTRRKIPEKAIPLLEEVLSISKNNISSKLIALCFNYLLAGKPLNSNLFKIKLEPDVEESNCMLLQYYQFYYKMNCKEKRVVLSKIAKLLDEDDAFFKFIIIEENNKLSDIKFI